MKHKSGKGSLELQLPLKEELVIGDSDIIIKHVLPRQNGNKKHKDPNGISLLIIADKKIPVNRKSIFEKIKKQKSDLSRVIAVNILDQALLGLMMNPSHMIYEDGGDYHHYLALISSSPTYLEEYKRWRDDAMKSVSRIIQKEETLCATS